MKECNELLFSFKKQGSSAIPGNRDGPAENMLSEVSRTKKDSTVWHHLNRKFKKKNSRSHETE